MAWYGPLKSNSHLKGFDPEGKINYGHDATNQTERKGADLVGGEVVHGLENGETLPIPIGKPRQ